MKRFLALLFLLCLAAPAWSDNSSPKTTVTLLPTTAQTGTATGTGAMLVNDATAIPLYAVTNGLCIAATTQGGTAPTKFSIFIQVCPDRNCTATTGSWDDYARFEMGTGSSKHVVGWTNSGSLHGHAICDGDVSVAVGTCSTQAAGAAGCLPPDCTRGYYLGDRVRTKWAFTGGDGTTTESFSLVCYLTAAQ
jgi:hypothetical protein